MVKTTIRFTQIKKNTIFDNKVQQILSLLQNTPFNSVHAGV